MRIAILVYPMSPAVHLASLASALADGLQKQGHQTEILNLKESDELRIGRFEYLCIGIESSSYFSSAISADLSRRMERLTGASGKRSFAFVPKRSFSPDRLLSNLMKLMELQGMYLRNSAVFSSPDYARMAGEALEVLRGA